MGETTLFICTIGHVFAHISSVKWVFFVVLLLIVVLSFFLFVIGVLSNNLLDQWLFDNLFDRFLETSQFFLTMSKTAGGESAFAILLEPFAENGFIINRLLL